MSPEVIIALVGCTASVFGALLVAAMKLGSVVQTLRHLTEVVESLTGLSERMAKVETRIDALGQKQTMFFEMAGAPHH